MARSKLMNQLFPVKKVEDLQPGDVVDIWWLAPPEPIESRTVKAVEIVERPTYKHNYVKVTFQDGSLLTDITTHRSFLTGTKIQVYKKLNF